ncbi:MAG: FG-GAP repeat protein [Acidobacteriota bacterium]
MNVLSASFLRLLALAELVRPARAHFAALFSLCLFLALPSSATLGASLDEEILASVLEEPALSVNHHVPVWEQVAELRDDRVPDGEYEYFGRSVAVDGDMVAVGAPGRGELGEVSLFSRHAGGTVGWGRTAILDYPEDWQRASFGASVSLDGSTLAVGAPEAGPVPYAGQVLVYERVTYFWRLIRTLQAPGGQVMFQQFGTSVSLDGDHLVVGTWNDETGAPGQAHIFERDAGGTNNWGHVTALVSSTSTGRDEFGYSVAVHGDTAVVGAHRQSEVHVFGRDVGGVGNWGEVAVLTGTGHFGFSVSIHDDVLVSRSSGRAHVYRLAGTGAWELLKSLSVPGFKDLSVRDGVLVVGHGGASTMAHVFARHAGGIDNWGLVEALMTPASGSSAAGVSVATDGGLLVVGDLGGGEGERGIAMLFESGDSDADGIHDDEDACPPGVPDVDTDADTLPDCHDVADLGPVEDAVDAIEVKLDLLELDLGPVEEAVAAVEAKLDDGTSFVSDAELSAQVTVLADIVSSRADQESVDALEAKADALEVKLDESLDVAASSRADQESVDALEAKADALEVKLDESLDVAVSSRASQASVDELTGRFDVEVARLDDRLAVLQESVDVLEAKLDVLPCEMLLLFRQDVPGAPPLPPHHPCLGAGCDAAGFEGMGAGEVMNDQVAGMTISGSSDVLAFHSGAPSCGDDDLRTPGDGPGNLVPQRNVLVLAEDGSCQPDDAQDGGVLAIDFDEPRGVGFVGLLDIDENGGEIRTYDADGRLQLAVPIPAAGDGSWQSVDVGACQVSRLELELVGSGALTQVGCAECERRSRLGDGSGRER